MRRRFLIAAGLCAVAAATVRAAAFHVAAVQTADLGVLDRLMGLGGWRWAVRASDVVQFFDPAPYAVLSGAVVVGALALRRRREAVAAAVLLAGSAMTTQLLKHALAAARPYPDSSHYLPPTSWPSGHTTAAVSLSLALVIVVPAARRRLVALFGVVLSAVTAFCLFVLDSHYPSDVAGAIFIAAGWACLAAAGLPARSAAAARLPQRLGAPRGDVEAA